MKSVRVLFCLSFTFPIHVNLCLKQQNYWFHLLMVTVCFTVIRISHCLTITYSCVFQKVCNRHRQLCIWCPVLHLVCSLLHTSVKFPPKLAFCSNKLWLHSWHLNLAVYACCITAHSNCNTKSLSAFAQANLVWVGCSCWWICMTVSLSRILYSLCQCFSVTVKLTQTTRKCCNS